MFCRESEECNGYSNRALLPHEVLAATAVSEVVRFEVFWDIKRLDEEKLKAAFNHIDLCMKIRATGYKTILTNDFVAEYHEPVSRGSEDRSERVRHFNRELTVMKDKWNRTLLSDLYYHSYFRRNSKPFYDLVAL